MPGWHAAVQDLRQDKRLRLLGITQEQHPDRCRLFAQWKGLDWPILHDPINALRSRAVPITTAIDEHGVVRSTRPTPQWVRETFLKTKYPAPAQAVAEGPTAKPNLSELARQVHHKPTRKGWLDLADAAVLFGGEQSIESAIDAYRAALQLKSDDASTHFRLGVSYLMRYESARRVESDFQQAVTAWGRALELEPNQYIYRRRIQQYGPRLSKPYPFYDWVEQAKREIAARGETPVKLRVEPGGAEIARPANRFPALQTPQPQPDKEAKIARDEKHLIGISAVVVPSPIQAGGTARVHLSLRPGDQAHWNNEGDPVLVWIEPPANWRADQKLHKLPLAAQAESREQRRLEFELQAPEDVGSNLRMKGYALYYVCEEAGGACLFLRQDFVVPIPLKR